MRCAEWAMQQARSSGYGLMTVLVAPSFAEGCMCADCMFACPQEQLRPRQGLH